MTTKLVHSMTCCQQRLLRPVASSRLFSSYAPSQQQQQQHNDDGNDPPAFPTGKKRQNGSSHPHRQNLGKVQQKRQRAIFRENRIAVLEEIAISSRTDAETKELEGLQEKRSYYEEQYDPEAFTEEHKAFKQAHNEAFAALIHYTYQQNLRSSAHKKKDDDTANNMYNVFYLDGPDAQTTQSLLSWKPPPTHEQEVMDGDDTILFKLDASQLYVANRHEKSCEQLRQYLPAANVFYQSAAHSLSQQNTNDDDDDDDDDCDHKNQDSNNNIMFHAFYLDGCGGYVPPILEMITAALLSSSPMQKRAAAAAEGQQRDPISSQSQGDEMSIVLGFSLVGGNRDVVNKEVEVIQHVVALARRYNYKCHHVIDCPAQYGIAPNLQKLHGSTLTTWLVLEPI